MPVLSILKTAAAGAMLGLMLVFPLQTAQSALYALTIFVTSVLPALLPFSICALLLTAGKRLPASLLALMGLVGGSPAGARLFAQAALSPAQARRYAAATGAMTPMFCLATLSHWLNSPADARLVLLCHLAAALLMGALLPAGGSAMVRLPPLSVPRAVFEGAQAMLTVAACVVLGTVGASLLSCALPRLPALPRAIAQCLLEVTSGCRSLIGLSLPRALLLPLLSAFTSLGGAAILLQNAAFWQRHGLSFPRLLLLALPRAGIAFWVCIIAVHMV